MQNGNGQKATGELSVRPGNGLVLNKRKPAEPMTDDTEHVQSMKSQARTSERRERRVSQRHIHWDGGKKDDEVLESSSRFQWQDPSLVFSARRVINGLNETNMDRLVAMGTASAASRLGGRIRRGRERERG